MPTVLCPTIEAFATLCAAFVREGLTFRGDALTLTITFTGGF